MRAFLTGLTVMMATPAIAQADPSLEAVTRELDVQVETLFVSKGAPVKGWSEGGALLRDVLRSDAPGPQMLFEPDEDTPTAMAYDVPVTALLPAGWYPVRSYSIGPQIERKGQQVAVLPLSPTMVMVVLGSGRQVGTAECGSAEASAELTYYRHPKASDQLSEMETFLQFFMDRYFRKLATTDICAVIRPLSRGRFRTSYYGADGRAIGTLNKMSNPAVIRPVAELPRLLKLEP